ncbi:hypothetical protein FHU28_005346 [Micromonospora echinospora]|uniref:Uncharacterized protein n=1 Tax=Micromonospora echinospora TaxID=1877 RepID=A0ABR6MMC9_MICEC|nr:hypothetical protein [Micromonospora echinospora]
MTRRRKGPLGPSKNRRTNANRWRDAAEGVAVVLKLFAYAVGLAVTLAGNGCGPN